MDMGGVFWALIRSYECQECKSRTGCSRFVFSSIHPRLLKAVDDMVPGLIRDAYGIIFTHKLAIRERVVEHMSRECTAGSDVEKVARSLADAHESAYLDRRTRYVALANACKKRGGRHSGGQQTISEMWGHQLERVAEPAYDEFGEFGSHSGWCGKSPSASYLRALLLLNFQRRRHLYLTRLNMVFSTGVLSFDGTYKVRV